MSLAHLLQATGHRRLDEVSARDITRMLRSRGFRASPSLFCVLAEHGEENSSTSAFDRPGLAVAADRLERVVLVVRPSILPALGGVAAVTAVAASIGLYRWQPYAVVATLAGIAAATAVWVWPPERLPRALPRGGLLGAGLAAVFIAVALVAFVAVRRVTGL